VSESVVGGEINTKMRGRDREGGGGEIEIKIGGV
jgi:hypothetical protein